MEAWMHTFAFPGQVVQLAREIETQGYAGLLVADSQNLNADVWVELALAGAATQRIALGPGVTNPVTRHPAVTASAAATLQAETEGRAVLGLGRGDSAVTQLGRKPVPSAELERVLTAIQGYLSGDDVMLDGNISRIAWVGDDGWPKVPVTVAATGPHVIQVAARHADRIDFTVGGEPARIKWAIDTARAAAGDRNVSLGAFLNVAVHPDRQVARHLVSGSTAIFARFASEGGPTDGLSDVTREGIEELKTGYVEAAHGRTDAPHASRLQDEFIDRFALVGPASEVTERLKELEALGLERVVVVPGSLNADQAVVADTNRRFAEEVLPAL
jgi:5,10-methylenetetrahydromethanopterin reductase